MRIAIIGAGSVGTTLGQAWLKHGEDVTLGACAIPVIRNMRHSRIGAAKRQSTRAKTPTSW
jgi:predicted dinucleotide-binding enzyme